MKLRKITSLAIIMLVIFSFAGVDWENNNLHNNGFDTIIELMESAVTPDLSVADSALIALFTTIIYATAGISLALLFGFIISLFASNILFENYIIHKTANNLLAGMRAIHELVWALFFVASIGFSPYSAVFAIAIPYGGMLGKVFTDIFDSVSKVKIDSFKNLGASPLQVLFYVYLPEAYYDLVSYSLYRYECAIRSTTILSFVGLGGIGLKIQLSLGDLKYNEMFTYVYALVLLVSIIDIWGNISRKKQSKDKYSIYLFALLTLSAWLYITFIDQAYIGDIFNNENLKYSIEFLKKLIGIGNSNPAFFDINEIRVVAKLTLETLQMSIISITISSILMIITVIFATRQFGSKVTYLITRGSYLFSRAIPELIWAMLIIFIIKPGIFAGAVALAIHNYGILSKLCAEVIEELDQGPLDNLKQAGANKVQLLIYGVIPMASKRFISYIIYRWEIILRTTIIVGFVGAGGLGYYFKLNMSFFHYTEVSLILICYLILVILSDYISKQLKRIYK